MSTMEGFHGWWASCGHACRGIVFAFRTQRNLRIHLLIAAAVVAAAIGLRLSRTHLILAIITVSMVILGEMLNTALEFALNLVEARDHPVVKTAKDIAAGGVFLAVVGAAIVGLLLFVPPLRALLQNSF